MVRSRDHRPEYTPQCTLWGMILAPFAGILKPCWRDYRGTPRFQEVADGQGSVAGSPQLFLAPRRVRLSPLYGGQVEHPHRYLGRGDLLRAVLSHGAQYLGGAPGGALCPRRVARLFPRPRRAGDVGVPNPHRGELYPLLYPAVPGGPGPLQADAPSAARNPDISYGIGRRSVSSFLRRGSRSSSSSPSPGSGGRRSSSGGSPRSSTRCGKSASTWARSRCRPAPLLRSLWA
jgi:hypothetical protein